MWIFEVVTLRGGEVSSGVHPTRIRPHLIFYHEDYKQPPSVPYKWSKGSNIHTCLYQQMPHTHSSGFKYPAIPNGVGACKGIWRDPKSAGAVATCYKELAKWDIPISDLCGGLRDFGVREWDYWHHCFPIPYFNVTHTKQDQWTGVRMS